MRVLKKSYLLLFSLVLALNFGVSSNHFAEESSNNYKEIVYIDGVFYDKDGKPANGWYKDGTITYYFKDGKKFTGYIQEGKVYKYIVKGLRANGYANGIYYSQGVPANWWFNDGTAWYFFKDGKKYTGLGVDGNGKMYFSNGKYANTYVDGIFCYEGKPTNGWFDDGNAWYFFKDGKKFTGLGVDGNGKMYFSNGKYANTYVGDVFCYEGKLANWWFNDGTAWYFFRDGKKFTGLGVDGNGERYFVNGKYANGIYNDKLYKDGVETTEKIYINDIFYVNGKLANWWYDDGTAWYFFKDGKKLTGKAVDGNGEMYFSNGKYANTYVDGIFCYEGKPTNGWFDDGNAWYFFKDGKKYTGKAVDGNGEMQFFNGKYASRYIDNIYYKDGKLANWWCDDGVAWYFFKDGKKFTGHGVDGNGERYFVEGKYANGIYEGKLYKDGVEAKGKVYVNGIFYDENTKPANWWYDDGTAWYFFQNGKKYTGLAKDGNGERYFVDGKYANGIYNDKLYKDGTESEGNVYVNGLFYGKDKKLANWWYDDGTAWYFFQEGKKYTGLAKDGNGERYFANGKYANGYYEGTYYNEGEKFNLPETVRLTNGIRAFKFSDDKFYTGCWLYSAASGLYSKGKYITPTDLLNLLPKTGDPRTGVMGDPKEHYYRDVFPASYPSGMVPTLQKLVPSIEDYSGASFEDIKLQLAKGRTVQVWFTREMLYKKSLCWRRIDFSKFRLSFNFIDRL